MELLKEEIQKNGYLYKLYKRGDKAMIYEQTYPDDGSICSYEVFKIRIDKPKVIFGISLPEREKFPGNEDFGKWAWAVTDLNKAMEKFETIESGVLDEA